MDQGVSRSYWNYRVLKREYDICGVKETTYGIYEVYYGGCGPDGEDLGPGPHSCTMKAIAEGDSLADLSKTLDFMKQALQRPVMSFESLEDIEV